MSVGSLVPRSSSAQHEQIDRVVQLQRTVGIRAEQTVPSMPRWLHVLRCHNAIKHVARVEAIFELNDTNADGSLTQDEALATTAWLVALDADGDGKIRRRELRKLRDMLPGRDAS